jgi:hypothetical protein
MIKEMTGHIRQVLHSVPADMHTDTVVTSRANNRQHIVMVTGRCSTASLVDLIPTNKEL